MAREKALAILGEEEFVRRQEAVQSEMRTDRFEQRFTLDDTAECRVARPRQYGFIQFTLRGEAQTDDGDSPCPCRGKSFPKGGYGRVQFPGRISAHPPPFRQRRTVHDETGIKTQTGRRKRKGLFYIFRERCGVEPGIPGSSWMPSLRPLSLIRRQPSRAVSPL